MKFGQNRQSVCSVENSSIKDMILLQNRHFGIVLTGLRVQRFAYPESTFLCELPCQL